MDIIAGMFIAAARECKILVTGTTRGRTVRPAPGVMTTGRRSYSPTETAVT